METETIRYIEKLANAVRNRYDVTVPVNDIDDLVKKMGGIIREEEFDSFCDGSVAKTDDKHFVIRIMPYEEEEYRYRTIAIARELGHLLLHMGYLTDDVWKNQKTGEYTKFHTSEQTLQANGFASALLMPKNLLKEVFDENSDDSHTATNVVKTAEYFGVPVSAVIVRGRTIGCLVEI